MTTAIVPIRSFDGLSRLAGSMAQDRRRTLMRRLAERTTEALRAAGADVLVVTGDASVRMWGLERGLRIVDEPLPGGLDAAAAAGVAAAAGSWMVVHADLPTIAAGDAVAADSALADAGSVIAPSHDGGTSLIGGNGAFAFSYGVGSFRRHVAAAPAAAVLVRPGLAIDLDRARDLATVLILADRNGGPSLV